MSITYLADDNNATFICGFRAIGPDGFGNFTYTTTRSFWKVDLSAEGIGGIESAQLIVVATSITGGGDIIILSSATGGNGWGAVLDSTQADFASTIDFTEDSQMVGSTGTYTFTVDPAHIDASGITYFRFRVDNEANSAPYSKQVQFAAHDHGTPSSRPILRLTLFSGQVIFVNLLPF